ncbi:MAG TPA: tRNA-specific adenosine deaminase [Bacteroidales bacterium]|nr:MAG: tRNA-specific adenosine deaminase [Bacteroidetes bacterium GWF2_33_38]OFY75518.1 MAG: tRNA-specific adenosine deaminase [Bacteroidetes bacterium RIFOXYA12_FULL_33_9]OFY91746.1 MAG: tRNA-specific adenosine deaminase [Bacteroidetes bacterium RIFOXYA2_FULL_33_7]HBF87463.1 tRNA-specific adenosine deaminase [Bacteroidales bacterium]
MFSDEYFMKEALKEAQKAFDKGEVPVGAVIVSNNTIIAKGHNLTETLNDVTAHAEMQVITSASEYLGSKFLNDCTLYVSLEPCVMCAGAITWARFGRIVIGAKDDKKGFSKINQEIIPKTVELKYGILENECSEILSRFFKKLR